MNDDEIHFALDQHTFFIVFSHCNNSPRIDIAALGHIILIDSQPDFLDSACWKEKQQRQML